jgi:hypothetical protein
VTEKEIIEEEKKISLPYNQTISSDQFKSLIKFNTYYKPINFLIFMITLFGPLFVILIFFFDDILLGSIWIISLFIVISSSIFLAIFALLYIPVPSQLLRTMYPQRTMIFFDLYPATKGCNLLQDVYLRLLYIFLQDIPEFDDSGSRLKKTDNFKFRKVFKKTIKRKSITYEFDIFDSWINEYVFLLYIIYIAIFTILSISMIIDYIFFYEIDNLAELSILCILFLSIILLIWVYTYEIIHKRFAFVVKKYDNDITLDNVKEFKNNVTNILKRKMEPLILIILTPNIPKPDIIEYIQSPENLIKGKFPITIIQNKPNEFKVIWTG